MVASENRWKATREELLQIGVSREFVERVHSPAGLDINSVLLEEIAISILAEIIEVRRTTDPKKLQSAQMTRKVLPKSLSRTLGR